MAGPARHDAIAARLQQTRAFRHACPGALSVLARQATVRSFAHGQHVWSRGDPSDALHVVLSGVLALQQPDGCRERSTVALVGPGESPGTPRMIERAPRLFDARVVTPEATVARLPATVLWAATPSDPEVTRILLEAMSDHCQLLHAKLAVLGAGNVEARLAAFMLDLAARFGGQGGPGGLRLRLTRELIGDYVEARPETVSRVLAAWSRAGLVRLDAGSIHVPAPERLRDRMLVPAEPRELPRRSPRGSGAARPS